MLSTSLPSLLAHKPSDDNTQLNSKAQDDPEAVEGTELVVSTPLLSRQTHDSRQLSRLDSEGQHCVTEHLSTANWQLLGHRLRLLMGCIAMYVDMGLDGNTLIGFGWKHMSGHQWLLRISILGPQLSVWYFLSKNGMSTQQTLLLISLCPLISLLLGLILEPGLLSSMATFAFCLSLEPLRLLVRCWNGEKRTELVWFSIADGLVEAPISAFLTLVLAMVLTQTEGEKVDLLWCASVLWGLLTTALTSAELHFYGDSKSIWEVLHMAVFVKLPGVASQVLGYIFFAYCTQSSIEGVPWLDGIEYIILIAFIILELALNYSILSTTCERLPVEVALLFSCAMCVAGPPGFLQKLDRARWPHAVQHAALNGVMAIVAFSISPPLSEQTLVMPKHYSVFVVIYLASLPWSLVAAYITTNSKSMPPDEAIRQTQARFTVALKSRDRIMSNLLMSVDGATPRIAPDLLDTGSVGVNQWDEICYSQLNGRLYCAPACSSDVLVIDPQSDVISRIQASIATAAWKWEGIAEAENGKLYCAPAAHSAVLVIEPLPDTHKISLIETGIDAKDKWIGVAKASNGKLYCAPRCQSTVLVIDPSTDSTSFIQTGCVGAKKCSGIVASKNGKIYCAPYNHSSVLVIDSATHDVSYIETHASGLRKWKGIVEASNGKLYCAPYNHSCILVIDPTTNGLSYIETPIIGTAKWRGIAQSIDGKLYCTPFHHSAVLVIDPATEMVELIDTGYPDASGLWRDIAACPNGIMYCAPCNNAGVLKIDPDAIDKWDQQKLLMNLGLVPVS